MTELLLFCGDMDTTPRWFASVCHHFLSPLALLLLIVKKNQAIYYAQLSILFWYLHRLTGKHWYLGYRVLIICNVFKLMLFLSVRKYSLIIPAGYVVTSTLQYLSTCGYPDGVFAPMAYND